MWAESQPQVITRLRKVEEQLDTPATTHLLWTVEAQLIVVDS